MEEQEKKPIEKDKEGFYFHFENVFKSAFTTLFGCGVMSLSIYAGWIQKVEWWQAAIGVAAGFSLLFMKDDIKVYISTFVKKKIDKP